MSKLKESCIDKTCSVTQSSSSSPSAILLQPDQFSSFLSKAFNEMKPLYTQYTTGQERRWSWDSCQETPHKSRIEQVTKWIFYDWLQFWAVRKPWKEKNKVNVTRICEVWRAFGSQARGKAIIVSTPPNAQVFQSQGTRTQRHLCTATAA